MKNTLLLPRVSVEDYSEFYELMSRSVPASFDAWSRDLDQRGLRETIRTGASVQFVSVDLGSLSQHLRNTREQPGWEALQRYIVGLSNRQRSSDR